MSRQSFTKKRDVTNFNQCKLIDPRKGNQNEDFSRLDMVAYKTLKPVLST